MMMMMISRVNSKNSFDGSWSSWGSCQWDGVVVVDVAAVLFVVIHSRDSLGNSTTTLLQIFSKRHQQKQSSTWSCWFSKRERRRQTFLPMWWWKRWRQCLPRPASGGHHPQRPPCRLPQKRRRDCYSKIQLRWRELVHELRWKSSQSSSATKALLKLITCKGDFFCRRNKNLQNIASRDTWGTFAKVVINFWIWIRILFLLFYR